MAVVLSLLSSVLWGTADFFGGILSRRAAAVAVVLVTQAFALAGLVVVVTLTGSWTWSPEQVWWGVAAGVVGPVGLISFYRGLAVGRMGVVSPIAATGVAVPVLVGLVRGDRPSTWALAGLVLAVLGVVLVGGPDVRSDVDRQDSRGGWAPVALALLAALGFGGAFVCLDGGSAGGDPIVMLLTVQRFTSVLLLAVPVLVMTRLRGIGVRQLPTVAAVGFGDVAANGTYALASTFGLLSVTAALGSMYPVMTMTLARVLLHERLSRLQGYGVVLALTGVVLLAVGGS